MTYQRKLVFTAACLGMLIFGVVMTTLGTILPLVIERFALDKTAAGGLVSALSLGLLSGSVVFGPIVDRYGYKGLLLLSTALVFAGLEGVAFAPSVGVLRAAVFAIGFGGGLINGGTNVLVADISEGQKSAGLSLLGVFYGVGAFSIPFVLGALLDRFVYTGPIAVVGAVVLLPFLFIAAIRFPEPKQAQGFPIRQAGRLLRDATLLLMGLMLFLQSGMEITVNNWTTTFFTDVRGLSPEDAAWLLSLPLVGMMLARLWLGGLLRRVSPAKVLTGFIGLTLVGALVLLLAEAHWLAAAGIFVVGAGLAAGFPVILGFVGERYTHLSGTAFSIVLVLALTGGTVLPYAAGAIGETYGLRVSFLIFPAALLLMAALLGIVLRRLQKTPAVRAPEQVS